jgi:hypothetical protein
MQHANFSANFWVGAICELQFDFAEAAVAEVEAWSGLLDANPAWHIAAHHAAFSATAICKLQLILRSCGCGVFPIRHNHYNPCD